MNNELKGEKMAYKLTKDECFKVLELYKSWNKGQTSVTFACSGVRTKEDDILDARRDLIEKVTTRLIELC